MRNRIQGLDRRTHIAVGGAMAFVFASRIVGLLRESLVLAVVGVHDFTDSYFALSTVVIWFQNFSLGALALYLVPRFLAVPSEERKRWLASRTRIAIALGVAAGAAFLAGAHWIEPALLGGRRALPLGGIMALALCIPFCTTSGILFAAVTSSTDGILHSAKAQLTANFAGTSVFVAAWMGIVPLAHALPFSLVVAQGMLWLGLRSRATRLQHGEIQPGRTRAHASSREFAATAIENAGANINLIVQQVIIGRLSSGAISLNAYVMRLVLFPLAGFLQPIQQRLLISFSCEDGGDSTRRARFIVRLAIVTSCSAGFLLAIACNVTHPYWPERWRGLAPLQSTLLLVFAYACYAGVLFSNQVYARLYFSSGKGSHYTFVMLAAYTIGLFAKYSLVPFFGIPLIPASSVLAEGCALLLFTVALSDRICRNACKTVRM